jgi:hypothetical protein
MKKQIRRAMIGTIAMMLMGVVSLTGVTYAWFSQSTTASVEGITLGIESKEGGVLMSPIPAPSSSGWSYKVNLQWSGTDFKPVSTASSTLTNGSLVFFNGEIDEAKTYRVKTTQVTDLNADPEIDVLGNASSGYYIKKNLYFKNIEDSEIIVTLGASIGAIANGSGLKGADKALRVAIIDQGAYDGTEANANTIKATDTNKVMIYEPDANAHIDGSTGPKNTYGVKQSSGADYINCCDDSANGDWETSEIQKANTTGSEFIEKVDSYYAGKVGKSAPSVKIPARTEGTAASYYKVTIYIWLEGQDVDCINTISGSDMSISLNFTKSYPQS